MHGGTSKLLAVVCLHDQYALVSTSLRNFVWLSGLRWALEQCFEEGKTELGMAHDDVRQYPGWYHHMLTTMLAHFSSPQPQAAVGEKSPRPDGGAVAETLRGRVTVAVGDGGHRTEGGRVGPAVQP